MKDKGGWGISKGERAWTQMFGILLRKGKRRKRGGRKNLSPGMGGGTVQKKKTREKEELRVRGGSTICQRGFVKDGAFEVITRHSLTRLPSTAHPPLSLPKPPYLLPFPLLAVTSCLGN